MKAITERVLFQRMKRFLMKEEGIVLRKSREGQWQWQLGQYYSVDTNCGVIVHKHVNLEEWARETHVLSEHETLERKPV